MVLPKKNQYDKKSILQYWSTHSQQFLVVNFYPITLYRFYLSQFLEISEQFDQNCFVLKWDTKSACTFHIKLKTMGFFPISLLVTSTKFFSVAAWTRQRFDNFAAVVEKEMEMHVWIIKKCLHEAFCGGKMYFKNPKVMRDCLF